MGDTRETMGDTGDMGDIEKETLGDMGDTWEIFCSMYSFSMFGLAGPKFLQ